MGKKITEKIRKKVAGRMAEPIDAVEAMRVPKATGINADAVYAVPGDAAHPAKTVARQRTAEPMMRKPSAQRNHAIAAAAERELMAYVTIFFLAFWAMVLPEFIAAIGKTIFG